MDNYTTDAIEAALAFDVPSFPLDSENDSTVRLEAYRLLGSGLLDLVIDGPGGLSAEELASGLATVTGILVDVCSAVLESRAV